MSYFVLRHDDLVLFLKKVNMVRISALFELSNLKLSPNMKTNNAIHISSKNVTCMQLLSKNK